MRAVWTGGISFGLVHIPVRMFSAVESQDLDLNLLRREDQCRIRYARVCRETGEEVPYEEIVRGYEYRPGDYVILEEEDFRRASPRKTRTIEILSFADAAEIDHKYLEKPYYLEPAPEARRAYALLREALERSGRVAVARFVLRNREHLAVLKAEEDVIVLNQMRYAGELRDPGELDLPGSEDVTRRELDVALQLIDQLSEPWRPEQYHDTYAEDLQRLVERKVEQKAAGREPEPVEAEEEQPLSDEVLDLLTRLSESLEAIREERAGRR